MMDARDRYDSLFKYYGQKEGIDWLLLKAQALAESALDPDAASPVGAKGLAQFMDRTWEEWRDGTPGIQDLPPVNLALLDPRDPEDAIRAQAAYMAYLLKYFQGEVKAGLAAYNWGMGRVRRERAKDNDWLGRAPLETREYVPRVLGHFAALKALV